MSTPDKLSFRVFVSDPIPFNVADKAPAGDRRVFSPLSSTLIFGDSGAVLADPPMMIDQTERVARRIEDSGKRLAHIFITHGHGDHWFGTAPLLQRFPGASAIAGDTFGLAGNELRVIEVGHSDTDSTTVLHVPSIGLVVAGDVVYNTEFTSTWPSRRMAASEHG